MRHLSRLLLSLAGLPLLASCVFLLDYDELEGKAPVAAGGAGGTVSEPQAGQATNGGDCGSCDDSDPCTVDTCDASGEKPECVHTLEPGLVLDGIDATLESAAFFRVSLVAGDELFYLSALSADADVADVTLYRLGSEATELETLEKVSELRLEGSVLSNVGLALDPAVGGLALHGFIAMQPKLAAEPKVFHLVNRNGKTTTSLIPTSTYRTGNPLGFPQALTIGSKVVGAWIEADGSIAVHDVGSGTTTKLGDAKVVPAATLSLLSTANDDPAVFFTSQDDSGALGTYVETVGSERKQVTECQSAPGGYVSSSTIASQLPGVWLGHVTRAGDDYLTTSASTLVCTNGGCASVTDKCDAADLSNGVRNLDGATIHFQTDPAGLVYTIVAVPQIALAEDGKTVEAKLTLSMAQVDFSGQGKADSAEVGAPLLVASMPTGEEIAFNGPDWPAVGILPTRQVAVAWIQPSPAGEGAQLRVQRYRMCLPQE
jgi:hypothetical protein